MISEDIETNLNEHKKSVDGVSDVVDSVMSYTEKNSNKLKSIKTKIDNIYYNIFDISTSMEMYSALTNKNLRKLQKQSNIQSISIKNLLNMTSNGLYQGNTGEEKIARLIKSLFDIDSVVGINVGNKYSKDKKTRTLAIHIDKMYLKNSTINGSKIINNKDIVFKFTEEGLQSVKGIRDNQTLRYMVNKWYHQEYKNFDDKKTEYDLVSNKESDFIEFIKKDQRDDAPVNLGEVKSQYEKTCYKCHESEYQGAKKRGDSFWQDYSDSVGLPNSLDIVRAGTKYMTKKGSCSSCTDKELTNLIKYLSGL